MTVFPCSASLLGPAGPKVPPAFLLGVGWPTRRRLGQNRAVRTGSRRPPTRALTAALRAGFILALLGACSGSPGPPPEHGTATAAPPPALTGNHGRIYFYRTAFPWMVAVEPDVIVNGQRVGSSRHDRYFHKDAAPGRYEVFLTSDPEHPLYLTVEAGRTRFVKTVVRFAATGTKLTAELVEESEARREIAALEAAAAEVD